MSNPNSPNVVKVDGVWQIEGKPREDFKILQTFHPSNLPGKTMIVGTVEMAPGSAPPSPPRRRSHRCRTYRGHFFEPDDGNEPITSSVGEFWYEAPGCHHQRSENDGDKKANFFVTMIVDDEVIKDGYGSVFVLDKEVEAGEKPPSK
ncbi:hypothetical protein P171DRAFT_523181 [Karstenula rhodostoma CBS 690.94]|uniref:Cupin 2 conserved barrel domain-containing protein n=1 Tax=Karstenula rhodostoma CBS 690.94 TaxID=1392251 RepID=A0A9P4PEA6_9PLEO|nr:hypothetical protein P171DRAFT_523181 [Karstenula rhodostoma CBS 690.94]